ncbi:MAG: Mov34/MPN/PAD-1 family protein [Candidatus Omnitrophica bacterium]|nr:Mov34/MPN/PAD-1 family protein [Candidatus Omnitrophota bacterium]
MKVIIPPEIQKRLISALIRAEEKEIGGILMGESLGNEEFEVTDITIQTKGGTFITFVRSLSYAISALRKFFIETNKDYTRYNYLGEWHSHPSFPPNPSQKDIESMLEIISDTSIGANFVTLVIVRLTKQLLLEGTATSFFPNSDIIYNDIIFSN